MERALASRNPRKTTTQRRAQAFAEAAARYSKAGRPSPSLGTPSWGPPISIMIPPGRVLKRMKKKVSAAKATKKTATPGIAKRQTRDANRRYTKGVFQCGDEYHKCCQQGAWKVCAALLALCITNELKWLGTATAVGVKYVIGH